MKIKEYYRMAKRSLKERKKNTRSTVRGLAVGFIILLPIIVSLWGINVSFNKQLNEKPYLLHYNVSNMTDYRIEMDNYQNAFVSGSKNIDFFDNDKLITNKIVYTIDKLIGKNDNSTKYKIEENGFRPINQLDIDHYSIIDIDKSDSYFPNNLTNYFPNGIFLEGYCQGFTNNGKKQVIISQKMLDSLGIKPDDIYKKSLTISSDSYRDHINSQEPISGFICKDYIVVGIIKKEVSELYNNYDFMNANLFFTSVNVYENQIGMLKPYYSTLAKITVKSDAIRTQGTYEYTYENYSRKDEINNEYMMLGCYNGFSNVNYLTYFSTNIYIESDSYMNLFKSYKNSEKYMNSILTNRIMFPLEKSTIFEKFQFVYELITFTSSIFLIISGIIIFCAIINVYVTIKNNVKERRFYLTMLRAIGAKDNTLPKIYMMESSIIVTRASILIMSIGFIISAAIKLLIDRALTIKNVSYNLSISWLSILLCIFSIIIFLYLLTFLISFFCTHRLSKKPIVSILSES